MQTPWNEAKKTRHEAQEARIGAMEGGQRQVNSGRIWRWKRDGKLWEFLIEARTTEAGSYRIEKKEFQQMEREALQTPPGLLPAMQVDLGDLSLMITRLNDFQSREIYLRQLEAEVEILREKLREATN